jgi:photosystem II stability/assembly factor-like uncharacterized protein
MFISFRSASLVLLLLVGVLAGIRCISRPNSAQAYPNIKVQFTDPRTGWIFGPRLLHTSDGGSTWQVLRDAGEGTIRSQTMVTDLQRVQFINSEVGVVWMGNTFIRSRDGGRTWTDVFTVPPAHQYQWLSFFFRSPEEGWAVGTHIHYTNDGGRTWSTLGKTPIGDNQRQRALGISPELANYKPVIKFTDTNHGLMARLDGEIYFTGDSGKTWQLVGRVDKQIQDICFINNNDGWLAGTGGYLARTTDGGHTWQPIAPPSKENLYSVHFFNTKTGAVVGSNSTILYTQDGGATWKKAVINSAASSSQLLVSVAFADELRGWAVGGLGTEGFAPSLATTLNTVLVTNDGGQTWKGIQL